MFYDWVTFRHLFRLRSKLNKKSEKIKSMSNILTRFVFIFKNKFCRWNCPDLYYYLPSWSLPSSAAWPVGKMVLTKMPILPFGESRPPTMENPRLFFPGPFSNTTVWNELGRVLFTKWWPLLPLFLFRGNVPINKKIINIKNQVGFYVKLKFAKKDNFGRPKKIREIK